MSPKRKNPSIGSSFESFLQEQKLQEKVEAAVMKRELARHIEDIMNEKKTSVAQIAKQMGTSRKSVYRLIDRENTSLSLLSLAKFATASGERFKIVRVGSRSK